MSNKITKTVIFEIEPSGNCIDCPSRRVLQWHTFCMAFGWNLHIPGVKQCVPCKDYLAEQKSRVYCDGCGHFWAKTMFGELEPRCAMDHEQEGEICNYYSNNCQDRSE